jgi:hypothetical protein
MIFLQTLDSCEFLVWDDELYEVNAANGGGQRPATMQLVAEFGKAFGEEFRKAYGEEFGKGLAKHMGRNLAKFLGRKLVRKLGRNWVNIYGLQS